ncbi:unnamed protein product [Bursaphelenchus xylophilus]|uniref:(pine wood nematode) hypothetical protein n=1 Tax=Bursaphelenchus xylophilus TaxID=6326 RepID=A0A1I7SRW6_BURXY|nr:unnamed protein product [Bursaphelenchus xylophilus]CAG9101774.1 unnamed protein product [Bursaphelenchus xylophilus]
MDTCQWLTEQMCKLKINTLYATPDFSPLDCRRKPLSSTILIVPTTDDGVAFVRNQRIPHALVVVWQAPINYDSLCRNEPTIFGRFHVHMANPHKK